MKTHHGEDKQIFSSLKTYWQRIWVSKPQVLVPSIDARAYDAFHLKPGQPRRNLTVSPAQLQQELETISSESDVDKLNQMSVPELKILAEEIFGLKFSSKTRKREIIEKIVANCE